MHLGRILLTDPDLHTESIVVTFMMNEKHANSLIDYVKTDDGQIDFFHKGVKKIIHDEIFLKLVNLYILIFQCKC